MFFFAKYRTNTFAKIYNMKKVFYVLTFILLHFTLNTLAQDQEKKQDQLKTQDRINLHDHLLYKDGNLYQVKDQKQTRVEAQVKLKNGTTIEPDGMFRKKNGDRLQLKNGECLDMDGKHYHTEAKFMERVRAREKEMQKKELKPTDSKQKQQEKQQKKGGKN
jgi:hypothetical protein